MARIIIWHRQAEYELDQIVEYLSREWGEKVTQDYLLRVTKITNLVAESPEIGMASRVSDNIRSFLITKHATMFYAVGDDNIVILNIFDNRQDPKKKKF